jgi:hypothetical protein
MATRIRRINQRSIIHVLKEKEKESETNEIYYSKSLRVLFTKNKNNSMVNCGNEINFILSIKTEIALKI